MRRLLLLPAVLVLALPVLQGCVGSDRTVVALLVAGGDDAVLVHAETFRDRVAATCEGCETVLYDAGGDAEEQRRQARQALEGSADVLVVEPVDPDGLEGVELGEVPVVGVGELAGAVDGFVGLPDGAPAVDSEPVVDQAREIVLGERPTLTFVPSRAIAEKAADVAVGLAADSPVEGAELVGDVPSWLFVPTEVRLDDLTTVLVGAGEITLDDLCEGQTRRRCERFGLV